jgi:hypothetical protein
VEERVLVDDRQVPVDRRLAHRPDAGVGCTAEVEPQLGANLAVGAIAGDHPLDLGVLERAIGPLERHLDTVLPSADRRQFEVALDLQPVVCDLQLQELLDAHLREPEDIRVAGVELGVAAT